MQDDCCDFLNRLAQEVQQGDSVKLEVLLEECRSRLLRYFRTRARTADEQTQAMLERIVKEVCSDAERRVILMHAQRETPEAIAQMLHIKPATVRTHLMRGRVKVLAHLIQNRPDLLGGAAAVQNAIQSLERDGGVPLTEAERRALQTPNPNQTDLRRAALKLAKYLRLE